MSELLSFENALKEIQQSARICVGQQTLPLTQSLGKIIAQDIVATSCVPPYDNSAMDGYALSSSDWHANKHFSISQRIPAGKAPGPLEPGSCARIFTGAVIPSGADTVIMQENATISKEGISFKVSPTKGENIRLKGQDMFTGQTVIKTGTKLSAMYIGLLSSLGITEVTVYNSLKVGILTTGDEVISAGQSLTEGKIFNSNGPMLQALVLQAGYEVTDCLHVIDTPEATETALKQLMQSSDVILSSGGVSVGEKDHVKEVLGKLGEVHLWQIAIKPGKPLVHATLGNTPFLGLPGNPSSSLVTFHWFASLLLAASAGQTKPLPQPYFIEAGFNRAQTIRRDEFLRVSIGQDGLAYAHPQQSSGALLAACESHGYLHIKANTPIEYGCSYSFYPFSGF